MTSNSIRRLRWLLAAGLAFSGAAARAANGVWMTQSEETAVRVGMTHAEVERPSADRLALSRTATRRDQPGRITWSGAPFGY
jgi:hypothetical protein